MGYFPGVYDFKSYVHIALDPLLKGLSIPLLSPFSDVKTEAQTSKVTLAKVPKLGNGRARIQYQVYKDICAHSLCHTAYCQKREGSGSVRGALCIFLGPCPHRNKELKGRDTVVKAE